MPRVLALHRVIVPSADRPAHLERLQAMRAHYARMNCRFWAFEEAGVPGAYLEFVEAADAATLEAARASAPEPPRDPGRIYREVELT